MGELLGPDSNTISSPCPNGCRDSVEIYLTRMIQPKREQMISYMSDLMEDATNFSWQGAKAAHAVLCCELERGTVTWNDSHRIDRIRRAHAQKHVSNCAKTWGKSEQKRKPWYCKFYQNGTCTHNKDHKVGGRLHRHVCATCLQQGKVLAHPEKDCSMVKEQTKNG